MTERTEGKAMSKPARLILALLIATPLFACSQEPPAPATPQAMSGLELTCVYTPSACNPGKFRDLYTSAPDKPFKTTFRGRPLVVPMGYVSDLVLIVDPRYPDIRDRSLPLVALGYELLPRTPANVHEFFVPYRQRAFDISVGARMPGAWPWHDVLNNNAATGAGEVLSRVRRADRYGLSVVGEDFEKRPNRRPCATLGDDTRFCHHPDVKDVFRPIEPNGAPSLMICTADGAPDHDAAYLAMPKVEQEEYIKLRKGVGVRRAACSHKMLYEPWNAQVTIRYPRHYLEHWREIEDNLRRLLASFEAAGAPAAAPASGTPVR